MLKFTSQSVAHHAQAYTDLKAEVEELNSGADVALKSVSKHDEDINRMLLDSQARARERSTKVAILEEDEEDEEFKGDPYANVAGISMAKEKVLDVSLQKQQEEIVDKLIGMNDNIRLYATNVEDRLKQAYKAGGYNKKFGYEGMNTSNMDEDWENKSQKSTGNMSTFEKLLHKDNRKLNRL